MPTSRQILRGLVSLSRLGRLQVSILMINVLLPFVVINGMIGFDDPLYLLVGLEFVVFTLIGIIYTIAAENQYAFYALMILQAQVVAYAVSSCVVGVLSHHPLWVRILVSSWCSLGFLIFLVLQKVVRKSWGWHAYQLAGANLDNLELYRHYQILSASTTLDGFYAVFFFTVQIFLNTEYLWSEIAFIVTSVSTIILCRPLQLSIRREKIVPVAVILVLYVIGFAVYVFLTVTNLMKLAGGKRLDRSDNTKSFDSLGEQYVVIALEVIAVCSRLMTILAVANSTTIFGKGLATFFPQRDVSDDGENGRYLINPADHAVKNGSMFSVSTAAGQRVRQSTGVGSYGGAGGGVVTAVSPVHSVVAANKGTATLHPSSLASGQPVSSSNSDSMAFDSVYSTGRLNNNSLGGMPLSLTTGAVFIDATSHATSVATRPKDASATKPSRTRK